MTAIEKLHQQIAHARETGTMVVLTPDEAQALLDAVIPATALHDLRTRIDRGENAYDAIDEILAGSTR